MVLAAIESWRTVRVGLVVASMFAAVPLAADAQPERTNTKVRRLPGALRTEYTDESFATVAKTSYVAQVGESGKVAYRGISFKGRLVAPTTGAYEIRVIATPGAVLTVNRGSVGQLSALGSCMPVAATPSTTSPMAFVAGGSYPFELRVRTGCALFPFSVSLQWKVPGADTFVAVPASAIVH